MNDIDLLIDFHKDANRQGPGSANATTLAMQLAELDAATPLRIADIGCGTGAATLQLARQLNSEIIAVDFLDDFLQVLMQRAETHGVANQITPLCASMAELPFNDNELDVIWSEGAIYNLGFAKGIADWRRFLKPGGVLVVSEITWLTEARPAEIQAHWQQAYAEIDTAGAKIRQLEVNGYAPLGYFTLPENCWLEEYYDPMQHRFADYLARHDNADAAKALVAEERQEIALYQKYNAYYSYGVYIARKME